VDTLSNKLGPARFINESATMSDVARMSVYIRYKAIQRGSFVIKPNSLCDRFLYPSVNVALLYPHVHQLGLVAAEFCSSLLMHTEKLSQADTSAYQSMSNFQC
jgi:hypothetical protein